MSSKNPSVSSEAVREAARRGRQSQSQAQVVVVGAGIVGLAHAWAAAKRGYRVVVLERHPAACGSSIRNFGMVWPIGQPNGLNYKTALASRALWQEFLEDSKTWHRQQGSLHLAYREDELVVMEEFASLANILGYQCEMLRPEVAANYSPCIKPEELLGALWSPTELGVDPSRVIHIMPKWLKEKYGVEFHFNAPVTRADIWGVSTSTGKSWNADRVVIAAGADFRLLYPQLYDEAGFKLCKLQMMRTVPQPAGWDVGPMIASGLTLRHYESFGVCSSLGALKERIALETPELDEYGIHVMIAQNENRELILGDSHEYGQYVSPYDRQTIDELILRELRKIVDLPNWTIAQRWHGVYPKKPHAVEYVKEIEQDVYVAIASGGCGMTMSFGLAEAHWQSWDNATTPRVSAVSSSNGVSSSHGLSLTNNTSAVSHGNNRH